jgi:hypothetical protein
MRTVLRSTIRAAPFNTLSPGSATCLLMIGAKVIPASYKCIRAAILFPSEKNRETTVRDHTGSGKSICWDGSAATIRDRPFLQSIHDSQPPRNAVA